VPTLADSDVMTVVLYLFLIILLYALDASLGPMYGFLGGIIGLTFGMYIYDLLSNLILSAVTVGTFMLLLLKTIGDMMDARREGI